MTDLHEALAQIKARAEKATEGPWDWECALTLEGSHEAFEVLSGGSSDFVSVASGGEDSDGEFIAHARTDVPRLVEAIEAALSELATQRSEADSLMERGESNRATEIRRSAGLVLDTITEELTGGEPS